MNCGYRSSFRLARGHWGPLTTQNLASESEKAWTLWAPRLECLTLRRDQRHLSGAEWTLSGCRVVVEAD